MTGLVGLEWLLGGVVVGSIGYHLVVCRYGAFKGGDQTSSGDDVTPEARYADNFRDWFAPVHLCHAGSEFSVDHARYAVRGEDGFKVYKWDGHEEPFLTNETLPVKNKRYALQNYAAMASQLNSCPYDYSASDWPNSLEKPPLYTHEYYERYHAILFKFRNEDDFAEFRRIALRGEKP